MRIEPRYLVYFALLVAVWKFQGGGGLPDILPDNAPIDVAGLHVLVAYQDAESNKLTNNQKAILFGADIRAFLDSVAGEDGWRVLDVESDLTHSEQVWKDAMAVPRQSLPWLVVANRDSGFSGPLTMTPEEFKATVGGHK